MIQLVNSITLPATDQRSGRGDGVDERLKARFQRAPYSALRRVAFEYREGRAILRGRTQTYFLKQMAQTLAASVEGVEQVVNHIDVG